MLIADGEFRDEIRSGHAGSSSSARPLASSSSTSPWHGTVEYSLYGDPLVDEWYAGRHADGSFVECNEAMTLAEALMVVERIPSPITPDGEVQKQMGRREIENPDG
jgi:hypothetical protein